MCSQHISGSSDQLEATVYSHSVFSAHNSIHNIASSTLRGRRSKKTYSAISSPRNDQGKCWIDQNEGVLGQAQVTLVNQNKLEYFSLLSDAQYQNHCLTTSPGSHGNHFSHTSDHNYNTLVKVLVDTSCVLSVVYITM